MDGLEKLAEVVLAGFGASRLLQPWFKRRLAHAKADEMKILARAEVEADAIRVGVRRELEEVFAERPERVLPGEVTSQDEPFLLTRTRERVLQQEVKRQLNIEAIACKAAVRIAGKSVSDGPIDDEWIARLFDAMKDVSSSSMQELWGKILAGEISKPGSVSIRCIETVRGLSKEEAALFEKLCPRFIARRFLLRSADELPGPELADVLRLQDAKLLQSDSQLSYAPRFQEGVTTAVPMADLGLFLTHAITHQGQFPAYIATGAGHELAGILQRDTDRDYAHSLVRHLRKRNYQVQTLAGSWDDNVFVPDTGIDLFPVKSQPA
jgi:hypothetical protein